MSKKASGKQKKGKRPPAVRKKSRPTHDSTSRIDKKDVRKYSLPAALTVHSRIGIPVVLFVMCLSIRLFLLRQGFDHQDAYREALAGIRYATDGTIGGYGWNDPLNIYLTAFAYNISEIVNIAHDTLCNSLSALVASLGLICFYFFTKNLVNQTTAIFVTLVLILSPFHLEHSVYFVHGNIELAFFLVALYLLQIAFIKTGEADKRKDILLYVLFGIGFGLLIASRVISGVLVLPLFAYMCFHYRKGKRLKDFALFAVISFLFCALTCLAIFPTEIVQEYLQQGNQIIGQYSIAHFFPITIGTIFVNAISVPLLITYAFSLLYLIFKRAFNIVSLSLFLVLPYCLFYGGLGGAPERYFLCTLPFILIPVSVSCDLLLSKGKRIALKNDPRRKVKRTDHTADMSVSRVCIYFVLIVGIAIIPWFGKRYEGHLGRLITNSRQNYRKVVSEKVGTSAGKNLVLVVADEPMIQYYNHRNPPETFYVFEKKNPYDISVPQEKLEEAMVRIQRGESVYMTTYALNVLKDTNLKLDYTTVWRYGNYALYKINQMYVE